MKKKKKLKNKLKEKDDLILKNIFIKSLKENIGNNFLDDKIDFFKLSNKKMILYKLMIQLIQFILINLF